MAPASLPCGATSRPGISDHGRRPSTSLPGSTRTPILIHFSLRSRGSCERLEAGDETTKDAQISQLRNRGCPPLSVSCPRCPDRKRPLFRNRVHFRPRSGWVPEEASSRPIIGHVTAMVLPMGIREVPKEMPVGSSIGPTPSEYGCLSWKGRVDLNIPTALVRLLSTRAL